MKVSASSLHSHVTPSPESPYADKTADVADDLGRFYGPYLPLLLEAAHRCVGQIEGMRYEHINQTGRDVVESWQMRIKEPSSMRAKLRRCGLEPNRDNAVHTMRDAVGVRVICPFIDDIWEIAAAVRAWEDFGVVEAKDYVRHPKENGYRSYHLILSFQPTHRHSDKGIWVELQVRTIAMDCWACIEHLLKYKRHVCNEELLAAEFRRCADELAATDLSLQTLAELVGGADRQIPVADRS